MPMITVVLVVLVSAMTFAQSPGGYDGPRTADGRPDLNGVWQALTTASWDIEAHSAQRGVPAGQGIVERGPIPYHPAMLARKRENGVNRLERDPLHRCYMPGVPRIMYMPFPFEITQTAELILMNFEYGHAARLIYTDDSKRQDGFPAFWMGDSRAHWEGDTLVVDVKQFTDQTWLDQAGNFHSESLHLIERYTPVSTTHIQYEATVDDPAVFTRPWKMSFPLYRRIEANVQVLEYECLEFVEPFLPWHASPAPGVPGRPAR